MKLLGPSIGKVGKKKMGRRRYRRVCISSLFSKSLLLLAALLTTGS